MITCPQCQNEEYPGAFFCSECGAQLAYHSASNIETTIHTSTTQSSLKASQPTPRYKIAPEESFALYLIEEETFLPSVDQIKLTLGRETPGQVITPDIDLSAYDAYKKGVSRLHATIKLSDNNSEAHIIDLDSENGTRVNGNRIPANSEVPLHNNDIITLGKLKIQVITSQ